MTAARFFLALALVWLLGAAFLSLLGLRQRRQPLAYMQPAIDFAIGASLLATIWTLSALLGAHVPPWLIPATILLLTAGAAARQWLCPRPPGPDERPSPPCRRHLPLTALLLLLFAIAAFAAGQFAYRTPMFWDGRYIWAFKAKAMYLDAGLDGGAFTSEERYHYTALDHPLALPALEAWVYQCLGHIDERYGKLVGLVYWLGIGVALAAYLRRRICWPLALGISLLAMQVPQLVYYAGSGVADVPFAFHFLAAALLLADWFEHGRRQDALMSALLFGTAALVKPEGIPLCLGAGLVFCVAWWRRSGPRRDLRGPSGRHRQAGWSQFAVAFVCLALPALPWLTLCRRWGIPSPQLTRMSLRPWEELCPRFLFIGQALWNRCRVWKGCELYWLVIIIGLLAYLISRPRQAGASVLWALFLWQFAAYIAIYALNPYPIQWTLAASLDRLLLHLMPVALTAACASLLRPKP